MMIPQWLYRLEEMINSIMDDYIEADWWHDWELELGTRILVTPAGAVATTVDGHWVPRSIEELMPVGWKAGDGEPFTYPINCGLAALEAASDAGYEESEELWKQAREESYR